MSSDKLQRLFVDRDGSDFFVGRDIYRDPEVFEWEMRHIFEGTWNLIGVASQIPNSFDYFTTTIGRTPIVVTRDGRGELHAWVNSCAHKGAMLAHLDSGSSRTFVCQYHGWAFDAAGKNILVKDEKDGQYSDCFRTTSHDLTPVARFANYRGLLFASLNPSVPELDAYLGDFKAMLDLVVDQSPHGVECIPGQGVFTYEGNWKLQMENGVDPYHFSSTHPSYILALQKRSEKGSVYSNFKSSELERGSFSFAHGHNAMWGPAPPGKATPLSFVHEELLARVGETRSKWMNYVRNITFFPNAQFADNASLQLRIWRPLAVDRTEMRTFCLAPVGEPAQARRMRIRQYEEFFNPSGLATPDDVANYEDCQRGLAARSVQWQQGHSRGQARVADGRAQAIAAELGMRPAQSVVGSFTQGDETVMHGTYRYWQDLIRQGLLNAGEGA